MTENENVYRWKCPDSPSQKILAERFKAQEERRRSYLAYESRNGWLAVIGCGLVLFLLGYMAWIVWCAFHQFR